MEWFAQNWVWVLFFAGMVAMHLFGHGSHGGHGGDHTDRKSASKDGMQRTSEPGPGHHH